MVYYFTSNVIDPPATIYVGKDKFESPLSPPSNHAHVNGLTPTTHRRRVDKIRLGLRCLVIQPPLPLSLSPLLHAYRHTYLSQWYNQRSDLSTYRVRTSIHPSIHPTISLPPSLPPSLHPANPTPQSEKEKAKSEKHNHQNQNQPQKTNQPLIKPPPPKNTKRY